MTTEELTTDYAVGEEVWVREIDPRTAACRVLPAVVNNLLPASEVRGKGNIVNVVVKTKAKYIATHTRDVFKTRADAEMML